MATTKATESAAKTAWRKGMLNGTKTVIDEGANRKEGLWRRGRRRGCFFRRQLLL